MPTGIFFTAYCIFLFLLLTALFITAYSFFITAYCPFFRLSFYFYLLPFFYSFNFFTCSFHLIFMLSHFFKHFHVHVLITLVHVFFFHVFVDIHMSFQGRSQKGVQMKIQKLLTTVPTFMTVATNKNVLHDCCSINKTPSLLNGPSPYIASIHAQ